MPFIIADRVRETSTTVGTGSIALAGAVTGYRTFASVMASTDTTYYTIADQGGPNWEVGIGTFTAPSTLARTTVLSSSNGGSLVNFTSGTKDVFISLTASRTNVSDQPNVIDTNSSSAALRVTQTGSGNSILVEDSANPDSSPFVVDASGNVGIGTTLPGYKLEVRGTAGSIGAVVTAANAGGNAQININSGFNSTVPVYGFWFNGDTGLGNPANQTASVITAGSERMRVDASGNVSLGNTGGVARLRVSGAGIASAPVLGNITNYPVFISNTDIAYGLGIGSNFSTGHVWLQAQRTDSAVAYNITLNEAGGNVGIGTSSPGTRLDVSGSIRASQSMTIGNGGGTYQAGSIYSDGNWGMIFRAAQASPALALFRWSDASDVERMRIDSNGNALINTTTTVSRLTVNGDVSGTFFVNPTTVSANYTIPTNYNAMTAGPITVNSGVVVTVPSGSTWTIL